MEEVTLFERRIELIRGIKTEITEGGSGPTLLFLHSGYEREIDSDTLAPLAKHFRVIAPSHPGFGASDLPPEISTVDDLSYFYLDLIQQLRLTAVALVGVSFGAWLASEITTKSTAEVRCLVLGSPLGYKVSDPEDVDVADIFCLSQQDHYKLAFHSGGPLQRTKVDDATAHRIARNNEAITLFAFSPYMHNRALASRVHRIQIPTLLIWGKSDEMTSAAYRTAVKRLFPNADETGVDRAGHYLHVEQPQRFAEIIEDFANRTQLQR
jgi:pimeloyl-ACP methyl ester carboxylesterase